MSIPVRAAASLSLLALSGAAPAPRPPAADPLTASVHAEDAERFAALFARTGGKPTARQLQRDYLDKGSYGVGVFTPGRIENADHLARSIAADPERYRKAIRTCLPAAKKADADLRAIYLGLHGALPSARLPQIYLVFGAGNSGGTAQPGAQVLGLEVLCDMAPDPAAFRRTLRQFFAHETVHSIQQDAGMRIAHDPLLTAVLVEGAADFIARLVTGEEPDARRAAWAAPREAMLWKQFGADIALTRTLTGEDDPPKGSPQDKAYRRWVANYNSAPDGWPGELGYWMGLRIWERYYAAAPDKRAALRDMLAVRDPRAILKIGHGHHLDG